MEERYTEIKKIIEEAGENINFAEFGDGIPNEWILKAEERLNLKLPPTYKWWLMNYSGGEIYGEEIYSIYGEDFDNVIGGDIVYMHELNKRHKNFPENYLVISETEDDIFYFNLLKQDLSDEMPVYSFKEKKEYANDFIDFLKKRIQE